MAERKRPPPLPPPTRTSPQCAPYSRTRTCGRSTRARCVRWVGVGMWVCGYVGVWGRVCTFFGRWCMCGCVCGGSVGRWVCNVYVYIWVTKYACMGGTAGGMNQRRPTHSHSLLLSTPNSLQTNTSTNEQTYADFMAFIRSCNDKARRRVSCV